MLAQPCLLRPSHLEMGRRVCLQAGIPPQLWVGGPWPLPLGLGWPAHGGAQWAVMWHTQASAHLSLQVTRPCSYSRKSHFDFEEEDVDKLEIR